ncbi:MAG: 30S ribosomal protein S4 [Clostridia bacterium]|nr:30S ribosomal protein S4 [Clostridia bacterium]
MARYIDESCRVCRREGEKLFLKGSRCYTDKCAITRRAYGPGQHGQKRKKQSEYGMQLREKQKAKAFYGVLESQFRKYFEEAARSKEITGLKLLQILESRLDNIVYRLGLATSRAQARQLVRHGHFTVNGHKVDIPSYLTKVGDVIAVKEASKNAENFKSIIEATENGRPVPTWLESNLSDRSGKVVALPSRDEIDLNVQEHLIVELYSK